MEEELLEIIGVSTELLEVLELTRLYNDTARPTDLKDEKVYNELISCLVNASKVYQEKLKLDMQMLKNKTVKGTMTGIKGGK